MGEAKRRGTEEQRRAEAARRNRQDLVDALGGISDETKTALDAGLKAFLAQITNEEWASRKTSIVQALKTEPQAAGIQAAQPIRYKSDEMGWYLYLTEIALNDPICLEVSQAARALPFIAAIGAKWVHATNVDGIERKVSAAINQFKTDPDGTLFEILVALSYAAMGWKVEMLEESPQKKSPDFRVEKEGRVLFVECKRQSRRADYAEQERSEFFRVWEGCSEQLHKNGQWIWLRAEFRVESSQLPTSFLTGILKSALPLQVGSQVIYDGPEALVEARQVDTDKVKEHLSKYLVKLNSPSQFALIGGDWAPANSAVTIAQAARVRRTDCEIPLLGTYVDDISWASGITRYFVSEESIERKARDVKNKLSEAVKQLPDDAQSVIHIAVEALEGSDVERRRAAKIMASIPSFVTGKPVVAVRVNVFQPNQTFEHLFEFDETVMQFNTRYADVSGIPDQVVVDQHATMRRGAHWETN